MKNSFINSIYNWVLAICGIFCLVGFIYLYSCKLVGYGDVPINSVFLSRFIGWDGVLLLNLLIFIALLPLLTFRITFSSSDSNNWKSKGTFLAFFIALFTEMFGFPLVAYIFSPLFDYPHFKLMRDNLGLVRNISLVVGSWSIFLGILLIIFGWLKLHKNQELVTGGLYKYMQHPQYSGFFLIIIGWCVFWPTLLTILIMPIMLILYSRLARYEEKELERKYKNTYIIYRSKTPRFLPHLKSFKNTER